MPEPEVRPPLSLADEAYARTEALIVTLALKPGEVFSEAALSHRLGIGRTPVREALQRLAADRLVAALPRRGMVVTEINTGEHLALLETRRVLERLVASSATRRALPEQREALRACADGFRHVAATNDLSRFMAFDRQSDELLSAASRNPYAAQALSPLLAHCRRFWYAFRHEGDLSQSASLHEVMLRAVAQGHADKAEAASDALIDYLIRFTRNTLDLY